MKKNVAIIGSGPAALMLAAQLDAEKFDCTIYEQNFAPARKFLVAGDGGFNLTHSEPIADFIERYIPSSFLAKAITNFSNEDLRKYLLSLGIETYVGSSKRIFPLKGIKPIEVLNAFLKHIKTKAELKTRHTWIGWSNEKLTIKNEQNEFLAEYDYVIFALGGASWSKTGSDGSWLQFFEQKNITYLPFQASNCAFQIDWPAEFIKSSEGKALKNIALRCSEKEKMGEVVISKIGLEGGAIYALSPQIREQLNKNGKALVYLDLKPQLSLEEIREQLDKGSRSTGTRLKEYLNISETALTLLKTLLTKEEYKNNVLLAEKIKALPLQVNAAAPIEEAISTVGGIALTEVDENFQLKKLPNHYAIGEMLNWDAPTGGYLLQGCFSMGAHLAKHLNSM